MKRHLLTAALSGFLLILLAGVALPANAETLLKGEVQQSDALPAVPSELQPGQTYDGRAVGQRFQGQERWYEVPSWLAGTWHRETEFHVDKDGSSQEQVSRYDARFGAQVDKTGQIWDRDMIPFTNTIDAGGAIDTQIVAAADRLVSTDSREVDRIRSIDATTDKRTGQILQTYQQEVVSVTQPQSADVLRCDTSSRVFDASGIKKKNYQGYYFLQRTASYQPVPELAASFQAFMVANGMASLVP